VTVFLVPAAYVAVYGGREAVDAGRAH